uniref:Protein kinase domain-containing protein n=1 Tax=Cucumis sativus TaxID=3659 RepID=A0A0A0K8D9_CUCSA
MASISKQLLLIVAALLATAEMATSITRCPDCGGAAVPYPLSTNPTCGDQLYKIRCDAGSLKFDTLNNTYPILSINPLTQRLVIRPSNFIPNTCVTADIAHEEIKLNNTLPFNVTSGNTILYFNCTDLLLRSPLNCSSTSLCHSYIKGSRGEATACEMAPLCCTFRAGGSSNSYMIRVRESGCRAYTSFVNLDPSLGVGQWPEPGLELQWLLPREPVCNTEADCDGNAVCGGDPNGTGLRRCVCNSGFVWDAVAGICSQNTCHDPDGCNHHRTALIAGVVSGVGAAVVVSIIAMLLYNRHRRAKEAQDRLTKEREAILNSGSGGGRAAKIFTGKEIKRATHNFSADRLLGVGGYGEVYKGVLEDGTAVAVKCAKLGNAKGTDQVLNEVRILCQVNHRSLVRLLGCCVELEQPILVYEYIPNGTLLDYLQGKNDTKPLSWEERLRIAEGTAEGLAYLHFSALPPIYHRDVKSSNILLDHKLIPKVSDFGLSRLAETDLSHISTCAQGTLGYLDPEYYRNYQLTDKSDVYSFGVVLLELLTSEKAIDFSRDADDVNLAVYVQRLVEEERLVDGIDPWLKKGASDVEVDTMKALGFLAVGCLEQRRQNRPSMKEVVEEIQYIISIAIAKP